MSPASSAGANSPGVSGTGAGLRSTRAGAGTDLFVTLSPKSGTRLTRKAQRNSLFSSPRRPAAQREGRCCRVAGAPFWDPFLSVKSNVLGQDIQGAFGFHLAKLRCVGLYIPDCDLRTSNIASCLPWTARFRVLKKKIKIIK